MTVYNAGPFLKECIDSIINQTYSDFQFLIIDDGSTDNSVKIIQSYSDSRIELIQNKQNLGLIATLNKGIKLIKTEYMIRQDADDIGREDRIEKLVEFMEQNQDVVICSSNYKVINKSSDNIFYQPEKSEDIKVTALSRCPLTHGASIIRVNEFKKNELWYNPDYIHAEDYEMLTRACQRVKMHNIQQPLYGYRMHHQQVSQYHAEIQQKNDDRIRLEYLFDTLKISVRDSEKNSYLKFIRPIIAGTGNQELKSVLGWADILKKANRKHSFFQQQVLEIKLIYHVQLLLYIRPEYNPALLIIWLNCIYKYGRIFNPLKTMVFVFRCLTFYKNKN